jgi:hypothetical protein
MEQGRRRSSQKHHFGEKARSRKLEKLGSARLEKSKLKSPSLEDSKQDKMTSCSEQKQWRANP